MRSFKEDLRAARLEWTGRILHELSQEIQKPGKTLLRGGILPSPCLAIPMHDPEDCDCWRLIG